MEQLKEYYRRRLTTLTGIIIGLVIFDSSVFITNYLGKENWAKIIVSFLTNRYVLISIFIAGELTIRKFLWKLEKAKFDFDGIWEGETVYEKVHKGTMSVPHTSEHRIVLKQDCISLKLKVDEVKEHYPTWGSKAINILGEDTILYAYFVNYRDKQNFPAREVLGYEELTVVERGTLQRPTKLNGFFAHCAQGQEPLLSGSVTFKRVKKRLGQRNG